MYVLEVVDLYFFLLFYIKYVTIRGISCSLRCMTRLISPVLSSFSLPQIARDEPGGTRRGDIPNYSRRKERKTLILPGDLALPN